MNVSKFNISEQISVCCGLVKIIKCESESTPPTVTQIPLLSVNVSATVVHAVAQVEITQLYANNEEQPIEAIYYFPVNPDGAGAVSDCIGNQLFCYKAELGEGFMGIDCQGRQWLARALQPQEIDDTIEAATMFLGA